MPSEPVANPEEESLAVEMGAGRMETVKNAQGVVSWIIKRRIAQPRRGNASLAGKLDTRLWNVLRIPGTKVGVRGPEIVGGLKIAFGMTLGMIEVEM